MSAINDYLSGITGGYLLDPAKAAYEKKYGVNGIKLYADMPTQSATGIGEAIQYGIDPFSGMVVEMPQGQVVQPQAAPVAAVPAPAAQPAPYVPIDWSKRIPTMRNRESTETLVSNALANEGIGTLTAYARPEGARMTGGVSPVTGEQLPAPPIVGGIGGGGYNIMPAAEMSAWGKAQAFTNAGLKEGTPAYDKVSAEYDRLMAASPAPTANPVLDELNRQKAEHDRYSWPEMLRKGQAAGIPMGNIIAKYNELQKVRPPALTAEQEKIRYEAMGIPTAKAESAAKTITVGNKVKQWNPATGLYDIEVGDAPVKGGGKDGTGGLSQKDEAKAAQVAKKEALAAEASKDKSKLLVSKVDEALGQIEGGWFTSGLSGAAVSKVPGTKAYNLNRTLDTIKANIGFEELQAMRQASQTGGALGQVAVKELDFLQSVLGSLELGQSESQLKSNLNAVKKHYANYLAIQKKIDEEKLKGEGAPIASSGGGKTITRTGMYQGRKVIQYSDGSKEYAP